MLSSNPVEVRRYCLVETYLDYRYIHRNSQGAFKGFSYVAIWDMSIFFVSSPNQAPELATRTHQNASRHVGTDSFAEDA
jgi:hypothetical protein